MIAQIEGVLQKLGADKALILVGQLGYEVMLPAYCVSVLGSCINTHVLLYTFEYYEGTPGGGNLIPRMVGFPSEEDRDFFWVYTSVKGMGIRKALKSMGIPIGVIASAIENSDEKLLMSLPGIGRKMAQQIAAELKGKLGTYAAQHPASARATTSFKAFQAEALEILIAWGEKRNEAMEFIELACSRHPDVDTAEQLVPLVYKLKQGVEV